MSRFFILLPALVWCALVLLAPAVAAVKLKTAAIKAPPLHEAVPQAAPQPALKSDNSAYQTGNPVTRAAINAGVLASASRIDQVITLMTANKPSGAYLFIPQVEPDQNIFSASLEIQTPNATPIYTSVSFAPLTSGETGTLYDSVEYDPNSCAFIAQNFSKDMKFAGVLRKDIIMLDGGPVRIFLMPAGTGCIVIKKEVVR